MLGGFGNDPIAAGGLSSLESAIGRFQEFVRGDLLGVSRYPAGEGDAVFVLVSPES